VTAGPNSAQRPQKEVGSISLTHWLLLGLIVLMLLGKGRFSAMMDDVAKGLKTPARPGDTYGSS
jgi:hypothetical protein